PISLPDDIKARLNLESRGRGRIWRISKQGHKPARMPNLKNASTSELVAALQKPNPWWRLTAQRLLVEKQARDAGPELAKAFDQSVSSQGRTHALWTLQGLGLLTEELVARALTDKDAGARGQALILAESFVAKSSEIQAKVVALVKDADPMVR